MKNRVLTDSKKRKKFVKVGGKVFTKDKNNSTINKKNNPLKVNDRLIYKRRDGLYQVEKEVLKEMKKGLNLKERIIVQINQKTFLKVFHKIRKDTINKLIK